MAEPNAVLLLALDAAVPLLERAARHYESEDCWYSCATLTCDDNRRSETCDCGAPAAQAALDLARQALQASGSTLNVVENVQEDERPVEFVHFIDAPLDDEEPANDSPSSGS